MWRLFLVILITTDISILLHVTGDVEVTKCVQGMNPGYMQMFYRFTYETSTFIDSDFLSGIEKSDFLWILISDPTCSVCCVQMPNLHRAAFSVQCGQRSC